MLKNWIKSICANIEEKMFGVYGSRESLINKGLWSASLETWAVRMSTVDNAVQRGEEIRRFAAHPEREVFLLSEVGRLRRTTTIRTNEDGQKAV